PHVLALIDDPARTVIEPIGEERQSLGRLYETDLMLDGGRVAGYAVDSARGQRVVRALQALANPQAFAKRYGVSADMPVMLIAIGAGDPSLAAAKASWDRVSGALGANHQT